MTEEEAKTKWCPHVRTVIGRVTSGISVHSAIVGNAYDAKRITKETVCIGSACMAWRYVDEVINLPTSPGYCGLAGKP